jgi:TetR/AcrR family transcriptional regulator, transcriptional repressor for nem operon
MVMARKINIEARRRILEAARELFLERGLRGVSIQEVAVAAGMKKANLFHYYPNKEALELAVLEQAAAEMRQQVEEQLSARSRDPVGAVALMFEQAGRWMRERRCRGGCFLGNVAQEASDHNEKIRLHVSGSLRYWTEQLAFFLDRARASGYFRPDLEPKQAAEAILALFEGSLLFSKASRRPDPVESSKRMAVAYLEGFRL